MSENNEKMAAIAELRAERDAVNARIEADKALARKLSERIAALEGSLPEKFVRQRAADIVLHVEAARLNLTAKR